MDTFKSRRGAKWSFDHKRMLGQRGGYGSVYLGYAETGTKVAIKVVPLQEGDEVERQQRNRELEIASRLSSIKSDHLIVPIDYGYIGDDLLIVMPLAEQSLKDAVELGLDQGQQYSALLDVALGLQELSEAGILHRDLKSRNVLAHEGVWKIADFGMSRDLSQRTATFTFVIRGSWPYLAPELWGPQPATVKSDLYAYGCLAFEVLSGRLPFTGPDRASFRDQHLQAQPPALPVNINPGLARLTLRLLAKEPARRPQDARAVTEELLRIGTPLTPLQERIRHRSVAFEQSRASFEAKERAERAASETAEFHRQQALSDLDELLVNAYEFLNEAIPDLRVQEVALDSQPYAMFLRYGYLGFDRMFIIDDIGMEFQVWRKLYGHPLLLVGRIVTGEPPNDNNLDYRHLAPQILANLAAEEISGRLQWSIYRFKVDRRRLKREMSYSGLYESIKGRFGEDPYGPIGLEVGDFWRVYSQRDSLFEVDVKPLTDESIAKLFEEGFLG
jgi:serine/threonine protein kinase